ncbi:PepSY-associated TM helix domain-containing protein [Zhouia amylolytica]|uniref:Putative iron-regulated membrane protein n=1 Tax=Zhouia amylolytica AD3 TaxID=1286632 RepID=W2UJB8_9FLAO|nr:PepSY-associated TM helix domain-containing protein [Zhouia amylolytica]ETN94240.1 putative iron-regulated membrane protein [Zhouia amylolytica AD3]
MKKKKKYGFRKLINDIHLWIGLISGIIVFIVCLTGTILTFEHEIKALFSESLEITPSGKKISLTELKENLSKELGKEAIISSVTLQEKSTAPYEFRVKQSPKERRGTTYFVDPYTGASLVPKKTSADDFMFSMFKLHRWLLVDSKIGRPIVGIATILFLILSISGIVLWFPKKLKWKNFKAGFKIKTKANWKRVNHDLHNTLGFYSCILILIMGLTGLCWSFEGYRNGLSVVMGTKVFGNRGGNQVNTVTHENLPTISYEKAMAIADQSLPYQGKTAINFPNTNNAYYSIRKYNEDNWSPVTSDQVLIDIYGNVLKKELFAEKPLNVQIASLIKPIHTGEIYGVFSKILYFLACLIGTSLPITGTLIWLNKMKKKKRA